MRVFVLSFVVVLALLFTSCGDDTASGVQGEAADKTIAELEAEGLDVDSGCVHDLAKQLSDADARAILNDEEVSDEGGEIAIGLLACVDIGDLLDE